MTEEQTVYFADVAAWRENTAGCLAAVQRYLARDPVDHVVLASCSGWTAAEFARGLDLEAVRLVAVKMAAAIDVKYDIVRDEEACRYLAEVGVPLVGGVHALTGGVDAALADKFRGASPSELIAHTLYLFSQGMKVAVEVALMAADHGLVPDGARVIACGGTNHGADTAVLLRAAPSSRLFDLRVLKVLAKPLECPAG